MAGLLLWAVVCAPLTGCLFPQDDQVPGELPPKRNGPIKIRAQVPREPRTTFYNGTPCPGQNPSFQLTVEDEDLADITYSRWFIGSTNSQPFAPNNVQGGTAARTVTAPNFLGFRSALANLTTGSIELLTVYVADTNFQEVVGGTIALDQRGGQPLPDGGVTPLDQGSYDSFTWTLFVEAPTGNCQ